MGFADLGEEIYKSLFDLAPDPIIIVDEEGRVFDMNSEAECRFGYSRAELVGHSMEVLVPERYRGAHSGYHESYKKTPKVRPMGSGRELFLQRKDKTEIPVEISLSPLVASKGKFFIAIVRDISDRKFVERLIKAKSAELEKANAELDRSNKELAEFAYIASHDLQEPLRSVSGACQLLKRRYGDQLDAGAQEFVEFAISGVRRMDELINDLLAYSRVSTKAREPSMCDLTLVLEDVLANLKTAIAEADAIVTHESLPMLRVDQWQIAQLLQNLVANSLKFRGERRPVIHISAKQEGETWHFAVRDNGIGIDSKYFDRIFVVFKRLHTREQYSGTGVGLASCKKIVERHNGRIWVESVLGEGTTFHFTLSTRQGDAV